VSYILEALKKAESERERGAVPGLHSQPAPLVLEPEAGVSHSGPVAWIAAVLLGVLVVLVGWRVWSPASQAPVDAPLRAQVPVAEPVRAPDMASRIGTPGVAPPELPVRPDRPDRAVTATVPAAAEPSPVSPLVPAPSPQSVAPTVARKPTPVDPEDRHVYAISELPESVRQSLPTTVVSGAMYADVPTSRMVVINGQVLHEGDQLTPDLRLVEIKLKSAVLRYRGYRYAIAY
jgi:general secretion pathway protein B